MVVANGAEERFSFWADSKEQETTSTSGLLDVLGRHNGLRPVAATAANEKAFLTRMGKQTTKERNWPTRP